MFGDLSVKVEGEFRLKFNLFEMRKYDSIQRIPGSSQTETVRREEVVHIKSIFTKPFQGQFTLRSMPLGGDLFLDIVLPPKSFPGMTESTFLSRSFADQGVKLRIRKEPRTLLSVQLLENTAEKRRIDHNRKRQLPRPEEYPPPRYSERPSSAYPDRPVTSVQGQQAISAYAQPDRDYGSYYAPAPKRQRNSVDMASRGFYDGDNRYARALDPYPPTSTTPYQGHPSTAYTQGGYHSSIPAGSPGYYDGNTQASHPVLPSQPEHPTNGDGYGGGKYNV